ncbi:MAG: diadenylate cyclase [Clostridia bacterium]|nr:diadenylate cyclase [Clostridia bacterium]
MNSQFWIDYWDRIKTMAYGWGSELSYFIELIILAATFYIVFKVLKENKGGKVIALISVGVILFGLAFSMSEKISSELLFIVIFLIDMAVLMMFSTEAKRYLLGGGAKKHNNKGDGLTVRDVEQIIDEIIHAVQHMSKNDIGALIVLSNSNLPEGIIASGTVINAAINSEMIEAVFYPKAPLHDGAMIIEGDKIHAAGCFLPLIQNEDLPQEVGSRHRAALGVTAAAAVTSIVVSEETGIISICRNGEIVKRYASDADLKNALSDYYWTDLTGKEKK